MIQVEHLSKVYGKGENEVVALNDVSFSVKKGEFVAIIGQQQRTSIGRALMTSPLVVLADEPTGNLDSKNSQEIIQLLKASNKKYNQTLIVITHDENIALQADRIIAIEDGGITRDEVIRG